MAKLKRKTEEEVHTLYVLIPTTLSTLQLVSQPASHPVFLAFFLVFIQLEHFISFHHHHHSTNTQSQQKTHVTSRKVFPNPVITVIRRCFGFFFLLSLHLPHHFSLPLVGVTIQVDAVLKKDFLLGSFRMFGILFGKVWWSLRGF